MLPVKLFTESITHSSQEQDLNQLLDDPGLLPDPAWVTVSGASRGRRSTVTAQLFWETRAEKFWDKSVSKSLAALQSRSVPTQPRLGSALLQPQVGPVHQKELNFCWMHQRSVRKSEVCAGEPDRKENRERDGQLGNEDSSWCCSSFALLLSNTAGRYATGAGC